MKREMIIMKNCHHCKRLHIDCYQCGNQGFYKFSLFKFIQEKVQNFIIKL
jgi:hypothetical protein